jgi:lipoprotein LprG
MRFIIVLAALVITLVMSCGGGGGGSTRQDQPKATLPGGTQALTDSAAAMRTVTSTHFTINVQGTAPEATLRYADGRLSRKGLAQGSSKVAQDGQVLDVDFVIIGNELYLRGPGGAGFQKLPLSVAVAGVVYDPSVILHPLRGIAAVLTSGQGATTEAHEQHDGVDSYRLRVTFPRQSLSTLIPGLPSQEQNITGEVWTAVENSRIVAARFPVTDGTITVQFSNYNVPIEVTPPV